MEKKRKGFYIKNSELVAMVERLQNSESGSVEAIREAFHDKIYGHIMRRTHKDEKAAIIILENVFSAIFASINTLRNPSAFVSFCNRVTENQITDYYRKARKRLKAEKNYYEKQQEDAADDNRDHAAILEAMSHMSPKQAEVTMMHVIKGIPVREISERLNIPEGTVKSRLYYGRKKLEELRKNTENK